MSEFLGSAWWLLVTLGILITFHEFGHFWVARRCGVKVLRFSVGFGKPIWSRMGKDGVEYAIGTIPLGGYVKFLDAREADRPELIAHQPGEYNAAPVWQRMAIAAAGPAFNIAFTVLAFWAMFVVGRPDFPPVIGTPHGLAAQAGFVTGDRVVAVDGERVDSMSSMINGILQPAMTRTDAAFDVIDTRGDAKTRTLPLSSLPADLTNSEKVYEAIGLHPHVEPIIGGLAKDMPAARAGMQVGDRIVRIGATTITDFDDIPAAIAKQAADNPRLHIGLERNHAALTLDVDAEQREVDGSKKWQIGIAPARATLNAIEHYGPLQAIPAAFHETWKTARATLGMIASMLTGAASAKNLSSVITIAQAANESAHMGLGWFLSFLALISLSLGILNLLPIPILDGGHLLYYLIELVKGSPLSDRTVIAGQYVGVAVLVALMSLAFYNDILRLVAG
jgi:regulator of sigma E protease